MKQGRRIILPYWEGRGRKLIIIPREILRKKVINNNLLNGLYITDMGFYPAAESHYYERKKGCAEMLIIICVGGKGVYETQAGQFEILPGQFFILPPNEYHKYEADPKEPWTIYWLRIGGTKLSSLSKDYNVRRCYKPMYNGNIIEVSRIFDEILSALDGGYSLQHIAYINMVVQHLLAILLYQQEKNEKNEATLTDRAILFMRENIGKHYTLAELSAIFNYSTSQFSNLFREETGFSPIDYFIQLKIQHCCKLLDLTDKKIYEVAELIGYNDPYYFSRLFKKEMHVSPKQYRAAKKG